jgi:hypothetical protein
MLFVPIVNTTFDQWWVKSLSILPDCRSPKRSFRPARKKMKDLLNRNAYILIALVPVAIYIMSYCLFEINAASSLKIKTMIVEAIKEHGVSPTSTIIEYKSRILWLSSSLLSITGHPSYLG